MIDKNEPEWWQHKQPKHDFLPLTIVVHNGVICKWKTVEHLVQPGDEIRKSTPNELRDYYARKLNNY